MLSYSDKMVVLSFIRCWVTELLLLFSSIHIFMNILQIHDTVVPNHEIWTNIFLGIIYTNHPVSLNEFSSFQIHHVVFYFSHRICLNCPFCFEQGVTNTCNLIT